MKHRAYIHYSADIEGIKFNSLKPEINHPQIESLVLKITENQKISFEFIANMSPIEKACELTREVADKVINSFYFFYGEKVRNLSTVSQTMEVTDEDGKTTSHHHITMIMRCQGYATSYSPINKLDPRFVTLVNFDDQKYFLYKQFGFAIQVDDPIARYMLLYSILLQTKEDKQKEVDNFIFIKEPGVERSTPPERPYSSKKSPQKAQDDETIYTKLRNEIGHVRKDSTFKETCRQIEAKVKGLEYLTKLAIEEFQPLE